MTITLQAVNELIASLESAGELSIREQKFLNLAKAYQQLAAENAALKEDRDTLARYWIEDGGDEDCAMSYCEPTPATDRIVAGIKSDGVEEFSKTLEGVADICGKSKAWEAQENLLDFAARGFEFAKQLRKGADK
ncbi:hypothetical protein [Klebsiella quasipneumoniae]|uniref:hypothetical protein n=1 Tax=Klebsiella quasipneumoniae TaxID=1463165 RepID=UPI002181B47C|nr:hypothetical protein [Klebsiella quasipneumoniae]GKO57767.1 hypothetical protein NUBL21977_03170 [Klebsiella quasipneumoniae]HCI8805857.1 hypothetical protein [Klebsiella quasipneumoniae]